MAPLILKFGNIEMSGQFHVPAAFFLLGKDPP